MEYIKKKEEKFTFVGISLSGLSTTESAVALIDKNRHIIYLDKIFSINDVKYYLNNFAGKQNAVILVSIPENETMLSSKWKYNSRTYDLVNFDVKMLNREDWTNRYSSRGSEFFKELYSNGIDIYRYDIDNLKNSIGDFSAYKNRTPMDCKSLQDFLRIKLNMYELPVNMLPIAQLEALLGALFARMLVFESYKCKNVGTFEGLPIYGL